MTTIRDITKGDAINPRVQLSEFISLGQVAMGLSAGPRIIGPIVRSNLPDPNDPRIYKLAKENVRFLASQWKIARNLQHMSQSILDPLAKEFGSDLRVYMGYMNPLRMGQIKNPTSPFFTGEAISMFLKGDKANMFSKAQDILDTIKGQFTSAQLMFNQISWLKITTEGPLGFLKGGSFQNPLISTFDAVTGQLGRGLMPMRGTVKNPYNIPGFFPFEKFFNPGGALGNLKALGQFPEIAKAGDLSSVLKQLPGSQGIEQVKSILSQFKGQIPSGLPGVAGQELATLFGTNKTEAQQLYKTILNWTS